MAFQVSTDRLSVTFDTHQGIVVVPADVRTVQWREINGVKFHMRRVQNVAVAKGTDALIELIQEQGAAICSNPEMYPDLVKQVSDFLQIRSRIKGSRADERLFTIMANNGALPPEAYIFYKPEEYIDIILADIASRIEDEENASGAGIETLIAQELGRIMIDIVIRQGEDYLSEDRITFKHPVDRIPNAEANLPHYRFMNLIDFCVNQDSPRTEAALVIGASIENGIIKPGVTHVSACNMRPYLGVMDPVRLPVIASGGIRRRQQLVNPGAPVMEIGTISADCTTALIALMDWKGMTHEEGIVIRKGFADELACYQPEVVRLYWINEGGSTLETHVAEKVIRIQQEGGRAKIRVGEWLAKQIDPTRFNKDGDPETVRVFRANCRWAAEVGFITGVRIQPITLDIGDSATLKTMLLSQISFVPDEKHHVIHEIVRKIDNCPKDSVIGLVRSILNQNDLGYVSLLIGDKVVTQAEILVEWVVKATKGTKLTTEHGWKGLICDIVPDYRMPHVKTCDNPEVWTPVDLIMSGAKFRKRDILSQIMEMAAGRLQLDNDSPFDFNIEDILRLFKERGYNPSGDQLRYQFDAAHLWCLAEWIGALIEKKSIEFTPDELAEINQWLSEVNKMDRTIIGQIEFRFPFRTFWGYCTIMVCNGSPSITAGNRVMETGMGLSSDSGNVKLGINEQLIAAIDSPAIARWLATLPRGKVLLRKLRDGIMGIDTPDINELMKEFGCPDSVLDAVRNDPTMNGLGERWLQDIFIRLQNSRSEKKSELMAAAMPGGYMWSLPAGNSVLGGFLRQDGSYEVLDDQKPSTAAVALAKELVSYVNENKGQLPTGWTILDSVQNFVCYKVQEAPDGWTCLITRLTPKRMGTAIEEDGRRAIPMLVAPPLSISQEEIASIVY